MSKPDWMNQAIKNNQEQVEGDLEIQNNRESNKENKLKLEKIKEKIERITNEVIKNNLVSVSYGELIVLGSEYQIFFGYDFTINHSHDSTDLEGFLLTNNGDPGCFVLDVVRSERALDNEADSLAYQESTHHAVYGDSSGGSRGKKSQKNIDNLRNIPNDHQIVDISELTEEKIYEMFEVLIGHTHMDPSIAFYRFNDSSSTSEAFKSSGSTIFGVVKFIFKGLAAIFVFLLALSKLQK